MIMISSSLPKPLRMWRCCLQRLHPPTSVFTPCWLKLPHVWIIADLKPLLPNSLAAAAAAEHSKTVES